MQNIFKDILKGKTVILGVGNILKADDGFGPRLIKKLTGKVSAVCWDAGTALENYLGKITREKPKTILIVDAAHLGRRPGECEILKSADLLRTGFSTHDLSPKMFIEYLEKETEAQIYLLAVEPQTLALGQKMSARVLQTLKNISQLIILALKEK